MMPADYHVHDPATQQPTTDVSERPTRQTAAVSIALTVIAVLVIVAAVLGVLIWVAA